MERRRFFEICAVGATGCAGVNTAAAPTSIDATPPPPKPSGRHLQAKNYARAKLVDADGKTLKARSLKTKHNYVFGYPFEGTPCFLLALDKPADKDVPLMTETGDTYRSPGGVGPGRNIVAYSAICSHQLAYPSRQVSFISYRDRPSPISAKGNVIGCCADKSVYDPVAGAKVVSGPAPQPLACILLEHDAKTDALYAVGVVGSDRFDVFFTKYEFKLSLEPGGSRAREKVTVSTIVRDLSAHSAQTAAC